MAMRSKTERQIRRWQDQRWVLDNIIRLYGPDWDQTRSTRWNTYCGPRSTPDIMALRSRIKRFNDISREFARIGRRREQMARQAEEKNHRVTARESYFMAALAYGVAQWGLFEPDNPDRERYEEHLVACYDKYIQYAPHRIERVEIPFQDGKTLPALLHYPNAGKPPYPCIVYYPGMDAIKEDTAMYADPFRERGFAVLSVDGPGQGASRARGILLTADNSARVGPGAVEALRKKPDIDLNRLVMSGISMGTYWGFRAATATDAFKACALMLPCWEPGMHTIFNVACPTYKINYMHMTGIYEEEEFDRAMKDFTLEGLEEKMRCPFLLIMGEDDDLSPMDRTMAIFNRIPKPKQLVVYEGQKHSIELPSFPEVAADFLLDCLAGKEIPSVRIYVEMLGGQVVTPL